MKTVPATNARPVVCSIGCTDPWNAAGVGLDILALADCGTRAVTIVAGITAQDRGGVRAARATAASLLSAQFDALTEADIAAYRVGALLDEGSVVLVAARLARARVPVVYDPALAPSGGGQFADERTRAAIVTHLLPHVTIVTPNLAEARALTGVAAVADEATMERAGRALVANGARAALVTGGHLPGDDVSDVYVDASGVRAFRAPRMPGTLRGTGCLLACGLAALLARGFAPHAAVAAARAFVRERFAAGVERGGMRTAY